MPTAEGRHRTRVPLVLAIVVVIALAAVVLYVLLTRPDHRLNDVQEVPYGPYTLWIVPQDFRQVEVVQDGRTKRYLVIDILIGAMGPEQRFSLSRAAVAHARLLGPDDLVLPAAADQAKLYRDWELSLRSRSDDGVEDTYVKPEGGTAPTLDVGYGVYFELPRVKDWRGPRRRYDFAWVNGEKRYVWDLSSRSEWQQSD